MMTREEATEKAKQVCKQLGPSWKPKVWENIGWYWSAELRLHRDIVSVRQASGRSYIAYLHDRRYYPAIDWSGPRKRTCRAAASALSLLLMQLQHRMDDVIDGLEQIDRWSQD